MTGAFEGAARAAITEIIQNHAQASKFGLILTPESLQDLTDDLFALLQTSRVLKSAGDRFLATGGASAQTRNRPLRPRPR